MEDATLLGELRATHERVDGAMERMEEIHRENSVGQADIRGLIAVLTERVDQRHTALQDQVNDVCERTDANTAAVGAIETRHQVTKARLGALVLLGGASGAGLKEIWGKVVAFFQQ